jgi:WD40 repeat-containing protein SMU1
VVTGSGDGTGRIWNGTTADIRHVVRPVGLRGMTTVRMSAAVSDHFCSNTGGSPANPSVLALHTPAHTMILVPRGQRAFLVNYKGIVLLLFQQGNDDEGENMFVAATVSSNHRWLLRFDGRGVATNGC